MSETITPDMSANQEWSLNANGTPATPQAHTLTHRRRLPDWPPRRRSGSFMAAARGGDSRDSCTDRPAERCSGARAPSLAPRQRASEAAISGPFRQGRRHRAGAGRRGRSSRPAPHTGHPPSTPPQTAGHTDTGHYTRKFCCRDYSGTSLIKY